MRSRTGKVFLNLSIFNHSELTFTLSQAVSCSRYENGFCTSGSTSDLARKSTFPFGLADISNNSLTNNGHITSIQLIVNTLRIIINVTSNPKQSTAVRDPILSKYGNLCHICWSLDWNIRMGRARPGTEIQIVEAISEKKNRSKNYTLPSRGLLFFYFNCSHFQALFEKRLCSQLNVRARCSSTILPR